MVKQEKLISLETERACLSSLISYNSYIADVMAFVKPDFFAVDVHSTIYSLITSLYQEKGSLDTVLLASKLQQLGIYEVKGLDIFRYLEVISNSPINKDHVLDYFKELVKYHFLRKTDSKLHEALKHIHSHTEDPLNKIIDKVSAIVTEAATGNLDEDADRIVDLYGELSEELSRRANEKPNPSLITNFPVFDSWYGGIALGDLFVFAAPAKRGKSTFLNYLCYKIADEPKNNVQVLYLDSEMESWRISCRAASSLTGINEWEFKTGKFAENPTSVSKVNQMYKDIESVKGKIHHLYIGNRPIEEVISICRRWYSKHVRPGQKALIAYDYIKLDAGKSQVGGGWQEYQEIGEKTDCLKKFASSLPDLAVVSSIQTNAGGDIASSQRLKWFASNVFILKPKELEQIQEDGVEFGTHVLQEVCTRVQGEDAKGMNNLIKVKTRDGTEEYRQNYINFNFSKFKVEEKGTYETILMQRGKQLAEYGKSEDDIDF